MEATLELANLAGSLLHPRLYSRNFKKSNATLSLTVITIIEEIARYYDKLVKISSGDIYWLRLSSSFSINSPNFEMLGLDHPSKLIKIKKALFLEI